VSVITYGTEWNSGHVSVITYKHINAANTILTKQFPDRAGFQHTLRFQSAQKPITPQTKKGTIQLHNVRSNHWVTTVCSGGVIRLFDSLSGTIDDDFAEQLRVTYRKLFPKKNLTVQVIRVKQQQGCTDCGLYAIAFDVDLAMGCTPSTVKYRQAEMRSHLKKCLQEGTFTRFPHNRRSCRAARPETVTVILN